MIPKLKKRTQHTFDRIGDRYAPYIDGEHFLGRSAFDDDWKTYNGLISVNHERNRCVIEVVLKGFRKNEVSIYLDDEGIHVQASKKDQRKRATPKRVNKTFSYPSHAYIGAIKATFKKETLRIVIPVQEPGEVKQLKID